MRSEFSTPHFSHRGWNASSTRGVAVAGQSADQRQTRLRRLHHQPSLDPIGRALLPNVSFCLLKWTQLYHLYCLVHFFHCFVEIQKINVLSSDCLTSWQVLLCWNMESTVGRCELAPDERPLWQKSSSSIKQRSPSTAERPVTGLMCWMERSLRPWSVPASCGEELTRVRLEWVTWVTHVSHTRTCTHAQTWDTVSCRGTVEDPWWSSREMYGGWQGTLAGGSDVLSGTSQESTAMSATSSTGYLNKCRYAMFMKEE